ncbi:MAG TPA: hypothetical protein VFV79_04545 [Saprospiraceae bacterium]|nr:hypothetical protein [Saprospiraceae bacterium]
MLSTTELFVEHIISGILSVVWMMAFVFCLTGLDPSFFTVMKEYWPFFALVTTAVAYPIGIMVDTAADLLLARQNAKIRAKYNLPESFSILAMIYQWKDDNIKNYFTYNRFKTRVARSSMINFLMISIGGSTFVWCQGEAIGVVQTEKISLIILFVFAVLALSAYLLWRQIGIDVYQKASLLANRRDVNS